MREHRVLQVLPHGQLREDRRDLKSATDPGPGDHVRRLARDVAAVEDHLARGRLQLAGQQIEERRLARAVRADDGVAVALLHLQADVFDRAQAAEVFAQVLDAEQRLSRVHLFGLDRLAGERLAHVEHSNRLAGALHRRVSFLRAMEAFAHSCKHGGQVRDAAGHGQDDAQHDGAEDDVELVGELLGDRVVQHDVDEGADRRSEECGGSAQK